MEVIHHDIAIIAKRTGEAEDSHPPPPGNRPGEDAPEQLLFTVQPTTFKVAGKNSLRKSPGHFF